MKPKQLEFQGIPEADMPCFATAVTDTLSQLGIEVDYDEISPPDKDGCCEYRVVLDDKPAD